MRRRAFITLLGGAAAWPLAARAQQGNYMRRIGVLTPFARRPFGTLISKETEKWGKVVKASGAKPE